VRLQACGKPRAVEVEAARRAQGPGETDEMQLPARKTTALWTSWRRFTLPRTGKECDAPRTYPTCFRPTSGLEDRFRPIDAGTVGLRPGVRFDRIQSRILET
jgi:hypothetical protein